MTSQQRSKRYAVLASVAAVVVCALLCFLVLLSPRLRRMGRVSRDLSSASKQVAEMRREIEDASIAGPAVAGGSRFEKFGILAYDEEQLFLSDLIDFCTETKSTLELVRRSDVPRPASSTPEQQQQGTAPAAKEGGSGAATEQVPKPVIERVLHTVNYSGTFLSSFYLLQKLESYKRLLTVERMEVSTDTRLGHPRVNGNITIDLYLVKEAGGPVGQRASSARAGQAATSGEQSARAQEPGHETERTR